MILPNNVDTEEMLQTLVNDVNKESSDTDIAISRLVTRKDKPGKEKKVVDVNSRLFHIFIFHISIYSGGRPFNQLVDLQGALHIKTYKN